MNYRETAKQIINNIGGKENISHIEHCSTRLRFTLKDDNKVNKDALESIEGVIGVRLNVQCQVIIGNDVVEVYDEVIQLVGDTFSTSGDVPKKNRKIGAVLLDFVISVFQPLVPAIAGGGILKSLLMLASLTGLLSDQSQTYQILNLIGGAPLYFLPILVAITTANKLKVNQLVAVSIVGAMILPEMTTMLMEGAKLFSFTIENIAYASQVFPAILTVLFYSLMERFFTKYSFKAIRIFFVPMMSMLITVPVGLLILGPLGYNVGMVFSSVIISLYSTIGWVATAILAAILPLMVVTGMHKAMIPYAVSSMGELGAELLYLPASLAHNIAESGACFAVSLKTKDKKLRSTAISAGISALFGITEPALYGVTILHKKVLMAVMGSSFIGGAIAGLFAIKAFALVGPGIASITMFADPDNKMNLVWAFVVFGASFVVAFLAALFLYKDTEAIGKSETKSTTAQNEWLSSPVKGQVIPLSEVQDDVFSSGMVGKGLAIIPEEGILYAPENGEITTVFETKHALGMQLSNGAEVLFHIGLDTVQMKGTGFEACVSAGDHVTQGTPLVKFDIHAIQDAGFDPIVVCVVTNGERFDVQPVNESQHVTNESNVLSINTI
ncbi:MULTISPECIES: beta-glucoside-specific PTS transporter subunit IIABC [unclassified Enterococcus]|uniref:beta-glucoside-specific PTS transporter subunit IIABC n=1 Tax=unclassified Enterococcus TaxID=2608891 RepID=UPI000A336F3A|nr:MULTISPECIES: beta-glucoside-specific PTS transporter subunit IIABC [unclassified Enterococcus]OTO72767.1 bglF [Enterococcus sp. 12E11_DIV0728]OUZ14223.1 bglF [Enterococcus sp. 12F9_DIV0723]